MMSRQNDRKEDKVESRKDSGDATALIEVEPDDVDLESNHY